MARRSKTKVDGPIPEYVQNFITKRIGQLCILMVDTHPWPEPTLKDAKRLWIYDLATIKLLDDASQIVSCPARTLRHRYEPVPGWGQTEIRYGLSPGVTLFPKDDPWICEEAQKDPVFQELNEWAVHRGETDMAWTQMKGLARYMMAYCKNLTQLKFMWPDFDLLVSSGPWEVPYEVRQWQGKFNDAGSVPKDFPKMVSGIQDYIEDARCELLKTVVAERHTSAEKPFYITESDVPNPLLNLPWAEEAMDMGQINAYLQYDWIVR